MIDSYTNRSWERSVTKSPLKLDELRYYRSVALLVRVIDITDENVTIEQIPSNFRVMTRAVRELEGTQIAANDGFLFRWATGSIELTMPNAQAILLAMLQDELADGRDRLRLRSIEDYLAPVPESMNLVQCLREQLKSFGEWHRIGSGSEVGYLPTGQEYDWQAKWRTASPPLSRFATLKDEGGALAALQDALSTSDLELLDIVVSTPWLPKDTINIAQTKLAEQLLTYPNRSLRQVNDQTLLSLLPSVLPNTDAVKLRQLTLNPSISPLVRSRLISHWRSTSPLGIAPIFEKNKPDQIRLSVFRDIIRDCISPAEYRLAIRALFQSSATPLHAQQALRNEIFSAILDLGHHCLPTIIGAIEDSRVTTATGGSAAFEEDWILGISEHAPTALLAEAITAISTLRRLTNRGPTLSRFSLSRAAVEHHLKDWRFREIGDQSLAIAELLESEGISARWLFQFDAAVASAAKTYDIDLSLRLLKLSLKQLKELSERIDTLNKLIESESNATRVLKRGLRTITETERSALMVAVQQEHQEERRRERKLVARLVADTLTTLERFAQQSGAPTITELCARLRELSDDVGLQVIGSIGEQVAIDHSAHDSKGPEGVPGVVKRVGVRDIDGTLYYRPFISQRSQSNETA